MTFNDNFGILIASLFRPVSTSDLSIGGFVDVNGVSKTLKIYGTEDSNTNFNDTQAGVKTAFVQIGKGTAIPTRQDEDIESPFTNSPEDVPDSVTQPFGYNSGLGKITTASLISNTGGAGSISEAILLQTMNDNAGVNVQFLFIRDLVSPVAGFIAGQSINTEFGVLI